MTLITKWALAILCSGLILASGPLADPGQEQFHTPPLAGQLRARDAVMAPQTVLHVQQTGSQRLNWERAKSGLPDFSAYRDVPTKKARFFGYLLPLVQAENERIAAVRRRLNYIYDHVRWHQGLADEDRAWLIAVMADFQVPETEFSRADFWAIAFERVDAVPEELVLVQAANESGWGTSRFAREGNNLFGQWCFRQGCGIVPAGRSQGATYEVARYATVSESVGSYMHNLNTGRTYQLLREIRARMRSEDQEPDAAEMAAGLMDYSERGLEYVNELRAMLRHNAEVIDDIRQSGETDGNQ